MCVLLLLVIAAVVVVVVVVIGLDWIRVERRNFVVSAIPKGTCYLHLPFNLFCDQHQLCTFSFKEREREQSEKSKQRIAFFLFFCAIFTTKADSGACFHKHIFVSEKVPILILISEFWTSIKRNPEIQLICRFEKSVTE